MHWAVLLLSTHAFTPTLLKPPLRPAARSHVVEARGPRGQAARRNPGQDGPGAAAGERGHGRARARKVIVFGQPRGADASRSAAEEQALLLTEPAVNAYIVAEVEAFVRASADPEDPLTAEDVALVAPARKGATASLDARPEKSTLRGARREKDDVL
mmetsp:Transcript_7512/g.22249  ORF Transcript_7512/g.22249 Transcript_7512/m.22249 type:complete len:157 (+) Transcript_7512:39-509(+)